jgi:hypothetical protein
VDAVKTIVRIFSYIFHGLLALFLLAMSCVALLSGLPLQLGMLPLSGPNQTYLVLGLALLGLLAVLLALRGKLRSLFFIWSLAVVLLMLQGFFVGPYSFPSPTEFGYAVYLTIAALIAAAGAWFQMRAEPARR